MCEQTMNSFPPPSPEALQFVAKMKRKDKQEKKLREKARNMKIEDALKHLSDHYIERKYVCVICDELGILFHKHDFLVQKYWDHDD